MKLTEIIHENCYEICLDGRFDADTCGIVESFIRERMANRKFRFILNMEKVSFIASAGLRVVLVLARELRQKYGGDIRMTTLQSNVRKVFEISGLVSVIQIYQNLKDALDSFR